MKKLIDAIKKIPYPFLVVPNNNLTLNLLF